MRKRFLIPGLLLAALAQTSMPAVAGQPATRPLDTVLNYQLHGVSLAMTVAQACETLEKNGFKADDPDTPVSDRLFWTYRRDNTVVGLQRLADDETVVVHIRATLLPEKGQDVDIGAETKRIMASWGSGANDKEDPPCFTREGAVKGKAIFGQCAVRDATKEAASYQAIIVRNQSVETLIHAAPARK